MNMFTQSEIILMIGVVSVLLICITILTILDIKEYLKEKKGLVKETIDFDDEYKEAEEKIDPVQVVEVENNELTNNFDEVMVNDVDTNNDLFFEEMEDEKFEEKENLQQDIKEAVTLPVVEKKEKKVLETFEGFDEIESNLPNKKDDVTNFEMEQERTAIISLDELMKKSDELYDNNEFVQYDDGNEPISIDEVIKMFNKDKEDISTTVKEVPEVMQDIVNEKKELYSKKETIPFISSVYGIEKENNALEFENTATYEKLDRQNYNDFVAKLREMEENK